MKQDLFVLAFLALACLHAFVRGTNMLAPLIVLGIFLLAVFVRESRRRKRADFITQLKSYRRELRSGGTVVVDNMMLRYDSPITSYHLTVGVLFTSIAIPSPYRLSTGEGHPESFIYSLLSLFSGWWAFPMGPILTLHYIRENLSGGEEMPVAMLIDGKLIMRSVEESTVENFTARLKGESAEDDVELFTGKRSRSNMKLNQRTQAVKAKTAEERIFELENPKPPGVVAVELMQAHLANFKDDFVSKIRKSIKISKKESFSISPKDD